MATGFQVVFALFAAVIPLIAFPAFYLFFKHKSSAVIYNRSFWSVVIQISGLTLYGFIGCVRYATLTLACAPTIVVQYSMLTMHLFALVERCVVLIASYEISMEARAYAEAKQEHRENIKIGWFLRNRKYFHHGLHSPTKLAVAVITVINVIISIAISKTTLGEFTETETEACKVMSSKISGLNNYFLGFAFLAMVVCSWRLYKVRENFGIRRELRNIAIMAAICIVWIVVANKIPSLKDSLPNVFYHIAIPVFELYFSLITVIRMARRNEASSRKKSEERRSSAPQNNNLSQASGADNSTNSGAHPVRSKFVNALMEIMSDDRRSREFELYMIHEFAVENLYFLRAVDEFHDASKDPKMEGEPLAKMAEAIYDKFCAPDSRLCINISSANRIELKATIANIGVMHQISSNVFDNAKKEIINLICQDTLRRFLRAEDANKKGPASVTGTSEMDRIPSGTGAKSSSVPVQTEAGANV